LTAAHGPEADTVRDELQALYRDLDAAIAAAGPVCQLSGRCCRFAEYGHTLFVSTIEMAVLLADASPPVRPLDDGRTCPWQDDRGHCAARAARPLGCRVYHCDPAYEGRGEALTEEFLKRLKGLADANGWAWRYAPMHQHLNQARIEGRYPGSAETDPESGRTLDITPD
jgi:Fe-S-cluster containining protein